jgi:hypothetical protein
MAQQPGQRRHVGQRRNRRRGWAGRWLQLQHQPGDDAQRALRADEQEARVQPGAVLDEAGQRVQHLAIGQHDLDAEHGVTHSAVAKHAFAAGIGGGVAADLAAAARAQVDGEVPACRGGG